MRKSLILLAVFFSGSGAFHSSLYAQANHGALDRLQRRNTVEASKLVPTGRYIGAFDAATSEKAQPTIEPVALTQPLAAPWIEAGEIPARPLNRAVAETPVVKRTTSVLELNDVSRPILEDDDATPADHVDRPSLESSEAAIGSSLVDRPAYEDDQQVVQESSPWPISKPMAVEASPGIHWTTSVVPELSAEEIRQRSPLFEFDRNRGYAPYYNATRPYQDGVAFGHNMSRLYHPLEGPYVSLFGQPTVDFGEGCDEWAGCCRIRELDFGCSCDDCCGSICDTIRTGWLKGRSVPGGGRCGGVRAKCQRDRCGCDDCR